MADATDDTTVSEASGRAPRRRSVVRERLVRHRRRRAGAVTGVAMVALVIGIVVGAVTGGGARHGHASAKPPPALNRIAAGAGRHAGSSAERKTSAESDAIDRTLSYTPYVRMAGTQHREIALTFDDGPGPYTPQILAILKRDRAPATFFEVGMEDRYFGASTAEIVAMGDPIGDHTETHPAMSQLRRKAQEREILEQTAEIGDHGASFPRMFRPPYGVWNRTTLALLKRYRMLMVLWSVDTDDWQRPGVNAIIQAAVTGAKPGAIILMHDAGGDRSQTVAALPMIIRILRRRGYSLVTVPRLLLDNPAPRQQDIASLRGEGG